MSVAPAKYEQLIQNLRSDLRPQREWGEGRGIFMVIGHFVVGIAAGTWLFALYYGSVVGLGLAWVLGALGGVAHLINLGHPQRFWRMVSQFRSSWISRGFFGLSCFLAGGFVYLAGLLWPGALWAPGSIIGLSAYVLSIVGMLIMMGYMGFVYSASKAIPFWNSPLHPALYVTYALRGGVAGLLLVHAFGAQSGATFNELVLLWLGITGLVVLFFALEVHGAWTGGNEAARRSVHDLFAGRMAVYFYGGTLLLGLLLPAWLAWAGLSGPLSLRAMAILGLASAVGDFFMKYSTIRAGVYLPIWTALAPQR